MEVIVHLPKSKTMQEELAKRMATIHAQAILTSVGQMECPNDQKIRLLKSIQTRIKEDMKLEAEG